MNATKRIFLSGLLTCSMFCCTSLAADGDPGESGDPFLNAAAPGTASPGDDSRGKGPSRDPADSEPVGRSDDSVGFAVADPFGPSIGFDGTLGDGLGFEENNYRVWAFIPRHIDPGRSLFFTSFLGGVTSDGGGLANVGGGYRQYVEGIDRIFGVSGWYDVDNGHEQTYQQLGLSAETMGRFLDARLNTYFVVGEDSEFLSDRLFLDPRFQQHQILFQRRRVIESAFSGGDLEVGGLLPFLGRYGVSAYIGGYFLRSDEEADDNENVLGVKVRGHVQVTEDFEVGVNYTHDDVFGANTWVTTTFLLPDGKPRRLFRPQTVRDRLASGVVRQYRVHAHVRTEATDIPAVDPDTGEEITVVHVDPNVSSTGDGTAERPFQRLESARTSNSSDVEIILVRPGTGGTSNVFALSGPLTLLENQRLLSTSVHHTFDSQFGTFLLPGFTGGPKPIISNLETTVSSIVVLQGGDEVRGFILNGISGTPGVFHSGVTGAATSGFAIRDNEFRNVLNGVSIAHVGTGLGLVTNNTFTGRGFGSIDGFSLLHSSGTLDLLVSNNAATGFLGEDADGNGILNAGEDADGDNVLDTDGVGFKVAATGSGTTINANDPENATQPLGILANKSTDNGTGFVMESEDGAVINADVQANTFDDNVNTSTGFRALADGGTLHFETFSENSVRNNAGLGASFMASGGGSITADSIAQNAFEDNAGAGLAITLKESSTGAFTIRENTFTGTVDSPTSPIYNGEGIYVRLEGTDAPANATATLTSMTIEDNVIGDRFDAALGNASHGIAFFLAEETTVTDLDVTDNQISHNGVGLGEDVNGNGVLDPGEDTDGDGILDLGPGGAGIHFERIDNAAVASATFAENSIFENDGNGIEILASNGGASVLNFDINDNDIVRNNQTNVVNGNDTDTESGHGIFLHVAGDARMLVNARRNLIKQSGRSGIFTTENFGAETDMREIGGEWTANWIAENTEWGIRLDATATNIFNEIDDSITANNLLIGGNLIDQNGLDGIEFNGPGRLTIDSNVITNNGVNAPISMVGQDDNGNGIDIQSVMLDENGNVVSQTIEPEVMFSPSSTLEPRAASPKFVEIFRNVIRGNAQDGLEIRHANNPSALHDAPLHPGHFPLTVIARENTIEFNKGRGVDILNQGGARTPEFLDPGPPETGADDDVDPPVSTVSGTSNQFSPTDTTVRLLDNKIASNGKEGVYVVNTASLSQEQSGDTPVPSNPEDPTRGLNSDGETDAVPRLALEVHSNLIIKNGQLLDQDPNGNPIDTITGSGLVLRVGTSDNAAGPLNIGMSGFEDFASAPGDPTADIFGETGFRNADEILQATDANFGALGFFNRLQPGGVIAKITNNGLDTMGAPDPSSGFEGNFGSDVYIESFQSSSSGAVNPVVARLDAIFKQNSGDSLDVTNFGAFFAAAPRLNGQRLAGQITIPGVTLPIFGRIVGIHSSTVLADDPSDGDTIADATVSSFSIQDDADTLLSSLVDDLATIYNGNLIRFTGGSNAGEIRMVTTYSGLGSSRITLNTPLPNNPIGDSFQLELSRPTIFDVVLLSGDPRTGTTTPITTNPATGALTNAIVRFIDDPNLPNSEEPLIGQQTTVAGNFLLTNGRTAVTTNPSEFHVQNGVIIDAENAGTGTGGGAVASDAGLPLDRTTSNQTLQVPANLSEAPRDENLFVITNVQPGQGNSAFRVSGATTATQAEAGDFSAETNSFISGNLGFDDAVSLESGAPTGDELPFEWDALPTDNETRINAILAPLSPLSVPSFQTFRDVSRFNLD